jgi:hypothetical protein
LKHTQQSFVVEMRRRRGRPTSASARAIEGDAFSAAVRAHSQDVRSDEKPKVDQVASIAVETYPARPVGRILPSLIEDRLFDPVRANRDSPQPVIPAGTSTKAGKAQDASSSLQSDERSVERPELAHLGAAAQLTGRKPLPLQSDEARLAAASSLVKRTSKVDNSAPTVQRSANSKTRTGRKKASPPSTVAVVTNERRSTPAGLLDAASDGDPGVSSERRRLILGRYVRGTELKFGERWKLRLRKERR